MINIIRKKSDSLTFEEIQKEIDIVRKKRYDKNNS